MGVVVVSTVGKEVFVDKDKCYVVVVDDEGMLLVYVRDDESKDGKNMLVGAKVVAEFSNWMYWRTI